MAGTKGRWSNSAPSAPPMTSPFGRPVEARAIELPSGAFERRSRHGRIRTDRMANPLEEIFGTAAALAKGMGITFKEMLQPTVTDDYPDAPPKFEERFRGVHELQRDVNGMEKCVACFLCAAACPANCIYIEAAENTDKLRISGGARYAKVYNIDYNRCIFCGFCVEACPTDAITHGHGFEIASYNTSPLVKRKEDMLVPFPAGAKAVTLEEPAAAGH